MSNLFVPTPSIVSLSSKTKRNERREKTEKRMMRIPSQVMMKKAEDLREVEDPNKPSQVFSWAVTPT